MADDGGRPADPRTATVVVNVQDVPRAVDLWCASLGYRQRGEETDPRFVNLVHPDGRYPPVSLQLGDAS